jgi:hypothetical protein
MRSTQSLGTESIKSSSLALECVHNIERSNSLSLGMLCISHSVSDYVLEEGLEHSSSFFVDEPGNALYTTSTSETANSGLGDALDVVTQDFAVSFSTAFAESFSSLSSSRHVSDL